jgi:hypothetical protein
MRNELCVSPDLPSVFRLKKMPNAPELIQELFEHGMSRREGKYPDDAS